MSKFNEIKEEKRMLLAMALVILVLFGFNRLWPKKPV